MSRHADDPSGLRRTLRRLPALAGDLPVLDPASLPADPVTAFLRWLEEALDAGVPEPHAVTVSTVDGAGRPSSRVVVLKDVDEQGRWVFATDRRSGKARDLGTNPAVALSSYWQPQGRQVRVTGTAVALDADECAADFLARSPASRAAAFATRPGEPLPDVATLHVALARARQHVDAHPDAVLADWVVYAVVPEAVELWQGSGTRAHQRVVYARDGDGWSRTLVWP
ncbi:pyridoxal 5'-phosphate synthase [Actinotalea sp. Marseille-Q4924]|uniref:pyridoxine/pyridoxamine 5'-phosphate oxidase n=1 Tax=Actinotalea sp. Marseille-Q4924 TaxID=2866571 RepID=UPI001CE43B26|nr:pyridoxal 5'-phosphate synthase [Actinotalea sp. Marseille-Q4924]